MDHSNPSGHQHVTSATAQVDPQYDPYVTDANGNKFRVPYRIIKRVTFTNINKSEMIDLPHAARLQYRLMLLDPILKASVDFTKSKITVIFNPDDAKNYKEKISLDQLRDLISKEGVTTDTSHMVLEDYDYYTHFYNYAFQPPTIRERAPYGYTLEQWQKEKPGWEIKIKKGEAEKQVKHKAFQTAYLEANPEMAHKIDPNYKPSPPRKPTLMERIFGKKGGGEGKGFWFHGI